MCKFINYIQKIVISYTKITLQFSFFYLMAQNVHFISPTLATTFFHIDILISQDTENKRIRLQIQIFPKTTNLAQP